MIPAFPSLPVVMGYVCNMHTRENVQVFFEGDKNRIIFELRKFDSRRALLSVIKLMDYDAVKKQWRTKLSDIRYDVDGKRNIDRLEKQLRELITGSLHMDRLNGTASSAFYYPGESYA